MSNSVFQSVMVQLKDVTDREFGVIDAEGFVVSSTDLTLQGERWPDAVGRMIDSTDGTLFYRERYFRSLVNGNNAFEYAVFCTGEDEQAKTYCNLAYISLSEAKAFYEEKHDRGTFVKNIIMDNILPGDIYLRAKELHFSTESPRAVFLVRQVGHTDVGTLDVVTNLFPDRLQDFVLSINETDVAVVKQINGSTTEEDLERMAKKIEDTLRNELFVRTVIGIGTISEHLRSLADSYKEAQTAIEVGKVFDTEKTIINYENLGIGRLIYQLPTTLCEIFLSEVFKKNTIESLDQETLFTINKFFENNLNVSETSRKLFVHRNTLVYRLEKIKKLTGLDLRLFDHAIVFKVALMVRKYLSSREMR
ncbi:MAG: helix-turn-helix domain-containing protein [Candidatus Faecousia sp.]|nr:helix-turn-helix domain-containing protein [Clostridiales bacterium]MDD7340614.1 helix-turn-helix domain-containing protein [Bacillota bacterium]MDY2810085.1 helix-turn-helix domain-containing protein [Candidatus Faecousia sp.]